MKREDLIALNVPDEAVDKIMAMNGADVEKAKSQITSLKEQNQSLQDQLANRDKDIESLKVSSNDAEATKKLLEELQTKYTNDTAAYKKQLADRDYSDAIQSSIAEKNVQFSSKAAERAYIADLKAKALALENGKLIGFDDFHKAQLEADPTAFKADEAKPQFTAPAHTEPHVTPESSAIAAAKRFAERLNIPKGEANK